MELQKVYIFDGSKSWISIIKGLHGVPRYIGPPTSCADVFIDNPLPIFGLKLSNQLSYNLLQFSASYIRFPNEDVGLAQGVIKLALSYVSRWDVPGQL
jgi:hypothetical protein